MKTTDLFHKISVKVSDKVGTPWFFLLALLVVVVWAITGPLFNFSDTWQLVINTGTTIVTFLMVFLIQNTQNRDNQAIQLKLDELIRTIKGARIELVDVENLTDEEIKALDRDFKKLYEQRASEFTKALHRHIQREHKRRHGFLPRR